MTKYEQLEQRRITLTNIIGNADLPQSLWDAAQDELRKLKDEYEAERNERNKCEGTYLTAEATQVWPQVTKTSASDKAKVVVITAAKSLLTEEEDKRIKDAVMLLSPITAYKITLLIDND